MDDKKKASKRFIEKHKNHILSLHDIEFIKQVASGKNPMDAYLESGYKTPVGLSKSNVKSLVDYKLAIPTILDNIKNLQERTADFAIADLRMRNAYTLENSLNKINEIQSLAMDLDEKSKPNNLNAAIKCEEMKIQLYGLVEKESSVQTVEIVNQKMVQNAIIDAKTMYEKFVVNGDKKIPHLPTLPESK